MSLKSTSLIIQAAPLPATFKGTPNDFLAAAVQRMKILSPNGTNFIFIGDTEPTSNVGPWLKGGTQWWVWDTNTKRYVPLDISQSTTIPFFVGLSTPASSTPPIWLLTTKDATDVDPTFGSPIGWYVFNGSAWQPFNSIVLSGPTANRPASPVEYQQYYDTDITCLIWWERSAWRTVSGVPGDIKYVAFEFATEALTKNPGWEIFGASNQAFRGRIIDQASKDSTGTETVLNVDANVVQRGAFEVFGASPPRITDTPAATTFFPAQIALWTLVKL